MPSEWKGTYNDPYQFENKLQTYEKGGKYLPEISLLNVYS